MASKEETVDFLRQRKAAYQVAFSGVHGDRVLEDLRNFCRADRSCWHPDSRVHAAWEGRREVWLRIEEHRQLEPEELALLYGAVVRVKGEDDE